MHLKFNKNWLKDEYFNTLVKSFWPTSHKETNISPMHAIHGKLQALKLEDQKWERIKKRTMIKDLPDIKEELERLGKILDNGNTSPDLINNIKDMEEKRRKIQHIQEVTQHYKSGALSLKQGENNTKKIHRYANYTSNINSIWHNRDSNGNMAQYTSNIQKEVVSFFETLYRVRGGTQIEDQIWGLDSYPTMFDPAKNQKLYKPIDFEEIHNILKYLQKINALSETAGLMNSSDISLI